MIDTLIQTAETVLFRTLRAIGPIIPNVTVRESHRDTTMVTDHPVEQGAAISDHAFRRPAELIIEAGWSNSSSRFGGVIGFLSPLGGGWPGYIQAVYTEILALNNQRVLLTVITGKRIYNNMLIVGLDTVTDETTENVLMLTIRLREVMIAQVSATTVAPAETQAQPQTTAAVQNTGTKQPQPVSAQQNESLLSQFFG